MLTSDEKPRTVAIVDGQNIKFSLWEPSKRCEHAPSRSEAEKTKERGYRTYELWDFEPTGLLTLEIDRWRFSGFRTKWCDRRNQSLESQIDSFLDGLNQAAVKAHEVEEERERERRAREIEEERRFEEQRQREGERRRVDELKHQASSLRQSRMIRELIEEVQRKDPGVGLLGGGDALLAAWIEWASKCAEDLDPVSCILDRCRQATPKPTEPAGKLTLVDSTEAPNGTSPDVRTQMGKSPAFDRTTLYELVWARPVQTVARGYGISGRGLAKACARLRVPVPPRGYWARVRSGHKERKPPLPSNAALRSV